MKVGIMQPYFLPYIGYWQLMNAVDRYVIFDDVNYINRGWIHRNRILINGQPHYINVPLQQASQNKLINAIQVDTASPVISKNLRTIEMAYKRAPYFDEVYPIMEKILRCPEKNLAAYLANSIREIAGYMHIKPEFLFSSQIEKDDSLHGQQKILAICRALGATEYYNAIGGQALYDAGTFDAAGMKLKFLRANDIRYPQLTEPFHPNLSILDVMMFNPPETLAQFLHDYTIVLEREKT